MKKLGNEKTAEQLVLHPISQKTVSLSSFYTLWGPSKCGGEKKIKANVLVIFYYFFHSYLSSLNATVAIFLKGYLDLRPRKQNQLPIKHGQNARG